jgi:hypothetical protein
MDLHHQFAVKINSGWLAHDEERGWYITIDEKLAVTRHSRHNAVITAEVYIKQSWNVTMNTPKPTFEAVRVERKQRMFLPW